MAYYGNEPADVALKVGSGVITATEIQDASIITADISNDAITPAQLDDDGTGFQVGSLGIGAAVSGSNKLHVEGTAHFTGNITGTLGTAAQTNITSVGTLTSFRSTGIDDNADALAITIDSSENVGIRAPSPSANLEIEDGGTSNSLLLKVTADDGNPYGIVIGNDSFSTTDTHGLRMHVNDAGSGFIDARGSGDENLLLQPNGGNVGIGTNSPGYGGNANYTYLSILNTDTTGDADRAAVLELAGNNKGNGVRVGQIDFWQDVDGGDDLIVSIIGAQDGTTSNNVGGKLRLQTKADNGSLADRLVIDESGTAIFSGNGSFSGVLECGGSVTGVSADSGANDLIVGNTSGEAGMSIICNTDSSTMIDFREEGESSGVKGRILYDHSANNRMQLWSGGSATLTLDGSSNATFAGNVQGSSVGKFKLQDTAGSASNPTYCFHSDSSTGMYRPANTQLAFATDGTQALIFGGDQTATFSNDVTITSANNPSLYITSSEANTDNFRIYVGGTGLSFYNTTDSKAFHFKHDGDLSFGHDGASVNTKTWGNAEVTGNLDAYTIKLGGDWLFEEVSSTTVRIAEGFSTLQLLGAMSKGSGSFQIDHPLPSKKDTHYLVHSFTESPRADLIYRDKVTLVDGSATVNIDTVAGMTEGTFVLLCDDVQCFTSNESDWKAVKGSVSGNILTIECEDSNSTADVAWMVIGDRKDKHILETPWTDENGKPIIEPEKEST